MTRRGRAILIGGSVVFAVVLVVFASRFGIDVEQGVSPVIGAPVPAVELPLLDDEATVSLTEIDSANEVVVVNFFASWCLQCRNEHADLVSTADAYREQSVQFIGVAFQNRDEQAIGFLDELGRGDTTLYTSDPGSRAAIEFGLFGVPETVFIRDGVVVGKLLGETDALTLSTALDQILAGEDVGSRQVGEFQQQPGA